jgi:hypothetical protein
MILPPLDQWDESSLDDVAASDETSWLEKKAAPMLKLKADGGVSAETVEEIAKQVSAFANSGDGFIVFGADHKSRSLDAGVPERVGKGGRMHIKEWVEQIVPQQVQPNYHGCTARFLRKPGHHGTANGIDLGVLAIRVPLSDSRPHSIRKNSGDVAYIRGGEHSVPMSHQTLLDISNRSGAFAGEIVSAGCLTDPIPQEKDSGGIMQYSIVFNPKVRLQVGAVCRHWAIDIRFIQPWFLSRLNGGDAPVESRLTEPGHIRIDGQAPLLPQSVQRACRTNLTVVAASPIPAVEISLYLEGPHQPFRKNFMLAKE